MSSETLNTSGAFSQAKDLKNRILFTILLLAVYRLGTFVPLPGIDPEQLQILMSGNQKGLLGMFNISLRSNIHFKKLSKFFSKPR